MSKNPNISAYDARLQRALAHIETHLDDELSVAVLSAVAAFSPFHFQRQFAARFGISAHTFVHLARMKRASHKLAFRDDTVLDVALEAGYQGPEAFARAFRQRFGQSPSSFRKSPEWESWHEAFEPLDNARRKLMKTFTAADVTIRDVLPTRVAIMEHRGDPTKLRATIQRFIAWRKAAGLRSKTSPLFNVWRSERCPASPTDFSVDICVGTDQPVETHGEEIKAGEIPGGRCAVLRVVGHTDNLEPAALYLYREWLPASGEELRDFPIYCQRLSFFPDVPEHETVADLFLPLK